MTPELESLLWVVTGGTAFVLGFALCVAVHTYNLRRRWAAARQPSR